MAITATTLSAAVAVGDQVVNVASATGISAPVSTTGSGFTILKIDDEMFFVISVSGTVVTVLRGQQGTQQVSHSTSTPVLIGSPSDFSNFVPVQAAFSVQTPYNFSAIGPPIVSATTIAPVNGAIHHVTGTTALSVITVPSGAVSGSKITLIFDGSGSGLTWGSGGNIAVAGTATTAASSVDFIYDAPSAKWIPSRLA